MRNTKRIIAILLMFSLVFALKFNVYAKSYAEDVMDYDELDVYAESSITGYLASNAMDAESVSISQRYPIYSIDYNEVISYMYFVFSEKETIGRLTVTYDDKTYHSSFTTASINNFVIGESYKLYVLGENLFVRRNDIDICIAGPQKDTSKFTSIKANSLLSKQQTIEVPVEYTELKMKEAIDDSEEMIVQRSAPTYYYLSCPYVANDIVDGVGLCWAACVASRVNYHDNSSLSAKDVYDACDDDGDSRPSGTPKGNTTWIKYAYSLYDINVTKVSSGKTFGQICYLLDADKPIYCSFERGVDSHGVLLVGVYQSGSTDIYMFRDPNETGIVSISVSSDALNDSTKVAYTNSYHTYSDRIRSIY